MTFTFDYLTYLASIHPIWFSLFGITLTCILFWLRDRALKVYVLAEIFAAICALINATPTFTAGFSSDDFGDGFARSFTKVDYLQIVGAIYFIVRGLDNLNKSLHHLPCWTKVKRLLHLKP